MPRKLNKKAEKSKILMKSLLVAFIATLLTALVGLVAYSSDVLGIVTSGAFLITFAVVFVFAEVYDYAKHNTWNKFAFQNILGSFLMAILIPIVFLLTNTSAVSLTNIISIVLAFIGGFIFFYLGAYAADWIQEAL